MVLNESIMDIYTKNLNGEGQRIRTWKYLAEKHGVSKKTLSSVSSIRKYCTDEEFRIFKECMYDKETVLFDNGTSSYNIEHIIWLLRTGCKIIGKGKTPRTTRNRVDRSCVYLLESGGYYKIGVTIDSSIEKRILALQTGNPLKITLVAKTGTIKTAYNIEKTLHEKFKTKQMRGEWFALEENDVASVLQIFKDTE